MNAPKQVPKPKILGEEVLAYFYEMDTYKEIAPQKTFTLLYSNEQVFFTDEINRMIEISGYVLKNYQLANTQQSRRIHFLYEKITMTITAQLHNSRTEQIISIKELTFNSETELTKELFSEKLNIDGFSIERFEVNENQLVKLFLQPRKVKCVVNFYSMDKVPLVVTEVLHGYVGEEVDGQLAIERSNLFNYGYFPHTIVGHDAMGEQLTYQADEKLNRIDIYFERTPDFLKFK
jgi:hypothetical protein